MAVVSTRVDDVVLATTGEKIEATDSIRIQVPKDAFGGTKTRKFTVDVSPRGQREIDRLVAKAEEDTVKAEDEARAKTRKAWRKVLEALGQDQDDLIAKAESKRADKDAVANEAAEDTPAEDNDPLTLPDGAAGPDGSTDDPAFG